MKRKHFLSSAAALSIGSIGTAYGFNSSTSDTNSRVLASAETNNPLNFSELRDFYSSQLFDRFLPNLNQSAIDHEYGGFMTDVNIETGERNSTNKRAWYEGRGMWTYAFLYNNVRQTPEILEVARKSKDFILRHKPETPGAYFPGSYDRRGRVLSADGNLYGDLFIAEGLAEYAAASGEEEYYDIARKLVLDGVERYDRPDYDYHISYLSPDAPQIEGVRVLGHWMVLLIGSTHMLLHRDDPAIREISDRSIDAIMNYHLNADYGLLNEGLNHDLSVPDNEFSQFAYTGHGIETLWMVMYEAVRRRDQALYERAAEAFKRHVTVAYDAVYGGYFRSLDHVDENRWKVDKVLWLQEEILIGTMLMIEHTGDEWARKIFLKTHDYVQEKFVHPGFRFWTSGGDRTLEEYNSSRAEHYHHPRHLMLNLLALDRIIERGGELSGLFDV
ncbi:MAG: AGE family epimerase/isomerase [Balneolaceae bacterium]